MHVAVFGATGGTGIELVRQALGRGDSVTAFVRDPGPLADAGPGLTIVTGDVRNPADVARAVREQDAVVCALGARDLKRTTIRATGTASIIRARHSRIPRADVAHLILIELSAGALIRQAVTITT